MKRLIPRTTTYFLPAAFVIACWLLAGQNPRTDLKLDTAVLADAPAVPQMVVDSDGTLHFGPRTVPPPALQSAEARLSYTRQMLQKAQTSAGRSGLASARILPGKPAPAAAGGSKETALKNLFGRRRESEDRGRRRDHLFAQDYSREESQ
jgi:hypothetical protein